MKLLKDLPFNKNFVVVTLVDHKGSVPQALGAKAMITAEGIQSGTVGGGKVEAKAIVFARELLAAQDSPICQLITWNLTRDVGMTCGGVVTFLFEVHRSHNWNIAVFGAGHVAQELVPMLTKLDCFVTCVDSRQEWIEKIKPKENLKLDLRIEPKDAVVDFDNSTFFILMTQGHGTDLPILTEILRTKNPRYLGVIGSRTKALTLRSDLKAQDFTEEKLNSFFCPIGLELGNNTPVEISHSVIAQILQVRGYEHQ